jgi:2-methylisocitrate lyase-like PEP mutase family enzyme
MRMSDTAGSFRQLHRGPKLLLLANCWDAGSARLLESLGAPAVATTSAGVAWAHGYPDGDALPVDRLIATVGAIARVIRVPLTVDMESGYSDDPVAVGDGVAALVDAGAVGINIEDGAGSPDLLAAKIAHAKQAAARRGVDLFVNARTDVFLRELVPGPARVAETLARASRYRDSGADGLFVPKAVAGEEIRQIAAAAGLPLNVLAWPGLPSVAELQALGVRRLSAGSAIAQGAWGHAATLASAFLGEGRFDAPTAHAMPYPEINALFASRS